MFLLLCGGFAADPRSAPTRAGAEARGSRQRGVRGEAEPRQFPSARGDHFWNQQLAELSSLREMVGRGVCLLQEFSPLNRALPERMVIPPITCSKAARGMQMLRCPICALTSNPSLGLPRTRTGTHSALSALSCTIRIVRGLMVIIFASIVFNGIA
jgi:hypothetical protein